MSKNISSVNYSRSRIRIANYNFIVSWSTSLCVLLLVLNSILDSDQARQGHDALDLSYRIVEVCLSVGSLRLDAENVVQDGRPQHIVYRAQVELGPVEHGDYLPVALAVPGHSDEAGAPELRLVIAFHEKLSIVFLCFEP